MPIYTVKVAGISFAVAADQTLETARPEGQIEIVLDPANKFARHPRGAFEVRWQGKKLGFVGDAEREVQDDVVAVIDSGAPVSGKVLSYAYKDESGFNEEHRGILSAVTISFDTGNKAADDPTLSRPFSWDSTDRHNETPKRLQSYNEPTVFVDFYEQAHEYRYEGRRLKSATGLVSTMYAPFNAAAIAPRCAKSWGMAEQDIIDMWNNNGNASAAFGTAIHLLIENYERYGERALPKMAVLRDIVTSFPFQSGLEVHSEVLLTCVARGICGLCDRLVVKDGRHTVCDMKVQHGADKTDSNMKNLLLPDLPKSKVGKAVAQCSCYSDMLELSGATVSDKVVVHVWDGEWKHYTEDRVKGILEIAGEW
jgi:hypothetical protein